MSALDTRDVIEIGDFVKSTLNPLRHVGFVTNIESRKHGSRRSPWTIAFYTITDASGQELAADPIDQEHVRLIAKGEEWWGRLAAELEAGTA